jgi:hypothetical protein
MRYWVWVACAALLFLGGRSGAVGQPAGDGWISLFNGKDLAGWTVMNRGDWSVANGLLRYTGGGNGWLRSSDQYSDFQVIAEWRFPVAAGNHDSGLLFRTTQQGNPWPEQFYQLNMGPGNNLASLGAGGLPGPRNAPPRPELLNPPGGEWNTYELIVVGDAATCLVNGKKAWDAAGLKPQRGYLGWQGEGTVLEIRSVRLRRLAGTPG